MRRSLWLCLLGLLVLGCGEPRIDTSSGEAYESSMKAVQAPLTEAERAAFRESIEYAFTESRRLRGPHNLMGELQGKTAREVIAWVQDIKESVRKVRLEMATKGLPITQKNIAEITALLSRARKDVEVLKGVEILEATFGHREGDPVGAPFVDLRVRNRTGLEIDRIFFAATLSEQGATKPLVAEKFHVTRCALKSGEEADWRVDVGLFGDWSKAPADASDLILAVKPVRFLPGGGLPEVDPSKVDSLTEKLAEQEKRLQEIQETLSGKKEPAN